jgi:hypothetical protein
MHKRSLPSKFKVWSAIIPTGLLATDLAIPYGVAHITSSSFISGGCDILYRFPKSYLQSVSRHVSLSLSRLPEPFPEAVHLHPFGAELYLHSSIRLHGVV